MRDYGFFAILSLIAVITIWLLLMPVVPGIASATMHRFHLRSGSFARFAAQFPIPAMYNFANRSEVKDVPPGFRRHILRKSRSRRFSSVHQPLPRS